MLYSESTSGFYSRSVNGADIPVDAVEITSDQYDYLVHALSNGSSISVNEHGVPVIVESGPPTAEEILNNCKIALEEYRESVARSGVVVNGVDMQTDRDSISAMSQYATESGMNGLTTVHWVKTNGTFHEWPIEDFKKLSSEITKYINDCFGYQSQLLDEINTASNPEEVDIFSGWPPKEINL